MKTTGALLTLCLAVTGCTVTLAPQGSGVVAPPPAQGSTYDQTIVITTANKTRESLEQTYTPNNVKPDVTRICVRNNTRGERVMTHNFQPRINPLRPASGGGISCANFPANSRVTFELYAAGRKAQADRTMSYGTGALAGGRIDLVWQ
jgi:hypothetical protein